MGGACCATGGGEVQLSPQGRHIPAPQQDAPTHRVTALSTMRTAEPTQRSPHTAHGTGRGGLPLEGGGGTPRHPMDLWVPRAGATPDIFTPFQPPPCRQPSSPCPSSSWGSARLSLMVRLCSPPNPEGSLLFEGGLIADNPPPLPTAMVELDGDDIRISSRGKVAERDIVQVWDPPALCVGTGRPPPPCSPLPKALGATAGPGVGMGG